MEECTSPIWVDSVHFGNGDAQPHPAAHFQNKSVSTQSDMKHAMPAL